MAKTVVSETVKSSTITNDQEVFGGRIADDRDEPGGGASLALAQAVIDAPWGTTATRAVTGKEGLFKVSVSSAGTGQGATATITITLPNGAFRSAPRVFLRQTAGTNLGFKVNSVSATQVVIGVTSAPVAANTYDVEVVLLPA